MERADCCDEGRDLGCDEGCEQDVHLLQEAIECDKSKFNDKAKEERRHQGVGGQIGHKAFHWRFLGGETIIP
jgi:hypothetical protein